MKLLIIRHADPDYQNDSLTDIGKVEAELLSERLLGMNIDYFYTSPLGRARKTAEYTLKKLGKNAEVCEWLREFPCIIDKPNRENSIVWDWLPKDWTQHKDFFDKDNWANNEILKKGFVKEEYDKVTLSLDKLLLKHGYERKGLYYNAVSANNDTVALFCHFGVECVLLGHLVNISPMQLWHGFCATPSSVTTVITEEREKGEAYFRINAFADTSHLYKGGREPSFAARFCETYDNENERH